jgi:cbb3-type cytochrome c oxidase subunit III
VVGNDVWRRRLALLGVILGAAALAAGCGTGGVAKSGDASRGKELFLNGANGKQSCASCHTLKAAGANGTIGPSLDNAFAAARAQGMKQSTIQNNVLDQIRIAACFDPNDPRRCMPRDLLTGADADAVAAYVAQVAGNPSAQQSTGGGITATSGKDVFLTAGCTSCHTLKDAGSTGTIGPNLDQAKPPKSLAIDRVTNGKGAMPSFKGRLSKAQIDAVAGYVSSVAGK